ncbi:hypothetical protein PC9H_009128 [Pleurotus ostreatus]|uniref:Uncharacterized protein n=1 Tax=Pleurotus ostreatus TaxID=5322 RepID=A0A8H6ZSY5_PLEOS|nr:uncharacterized protein PC9H_009128 [Pleurotus ostreatus]KAF7426759.1 hypothetical protein PC9H_009128 [Pleurotus ostreatus]
MNSFDAKKGLLTIYKSYIEGIEIRFDCSWSPESAVSFHAVRKNSTRLFSKKNCPKAFRWTLRQRKQIWDDIVIQCAKDGRERSDVVATWDIIADMATQAKYDRQGEAHIAIKHMFAFGTSTCCVLVRRRKLERKELTLDRTGGERTIIDDMCEAAAPHASDYRHTEIKSIERGLSRADLDGEFTKPQTRVIRHRGPTPSESRARPCFLMVHLSINSWAPRDGRPSFIGKCFPISQQLPPRSPLEHVQISQAALSLAAPFSLAVDGAHHSILINYINTMRDGYFDAIYGGNVGGTNNTNSTSSWSAEGWGQKARLTSSEEDEAPHEKNQREEQSRSCRRPALARAPIPTFGFQRSTFNPSEYPTHTTYFMDPIACTTSRNFSAKSELGEFRNKASTWLRILPLVLTQAGSDAYAQRRGRRDRRGSIDRTGSYIIGVPGSLPFNISIFRLELLTERTQYTVHKRHQHDIPR